MAPVDSSVLDVSPPGARRGARIALAVAVVLGLALIVWAYTFPAYSGTETRDGVTRELTRTLIEENGIGVLVPVSVPLLVSLIVAALVLRGRNPAARVGAWVLVGLLAVFAVLALFSIGMYVAPITVALAVAVGWPRRRASA